MLCGTNINECYIQFWSTPIVNSVKTSLRDIIELPVSLIMFEKWDRPLIAVWDKIGFRANLYIWIYCISLATNLSEWTFNIFS